jgi:spore cortex formation protein SpoVR/YcgB (stage V sporulation)
VQMSEFVLPYEAVRISAQPEDDLLAFLHSSYAAAADLAGWDRQSLERGRV